MWKPWKSGFSPYGASKTPLENLWKSGVFVHTFSTLAFTLPAWEGRWTVRISIQERTFPARAGQNRPTKGAKNPHQGEFSTFSTLCGKLYMENKNELLQGFQDSPHIFSTDFSTKTSRKRLILFGHLMAEKRRDS